MFRSRFICVRIDIDTPLYLIPKVLYENSLADHRKHIYRRVRLTTLIDT